MKKLVINAKKSGFPIEIEGESFWFDCSVESVERFQLKQVELQETIDKLDGKEGTLKDNLNCIEQAYDSILEKGAFKKLYKKIPDIYAWIESFFPLIEGINERINEFVSEQSNTFTSITEEYLSKKQ